MRYRVIFCSCASGGRPGRKFAPVVLGLFPKNVDGDAHSNASPEPAFPTFLTFLIAIRRYRHCSRYHLPNGRRIATTATCCQLCFFSFLVSPKCPLIVINRSGQFPLNHNDLFDDAPLLSWLPDETLFSLTSRQHGFWGHRQAKDTSVLLYGRPHGGNQHDFPSCIDEFVERTRQCHGTAMEICTGRTLLGYYRKFMNAPEEGNVIATLRGTTVAHLKFRLGLLTSRFRAHHPLKACAACMESDLKTWGWAYWHLQHQFPGVWICPTHGTLLQESDSKASGVGRFLWHLPNEADFRTWPSAPDDLDHAAFDRLSQISNLTVSLVCSQMPGRIDPTQLHRLYHAELERRNLLTPHGGYRLSEIAAEFANHVRTLRTLPEFSALPATVEEAYSQLSRYLRAPRGGTHPLRHLVLIDWLLGNSENFQKLYAQLLSPVQRSYTVAPGAQTPAMRPANNQDDRKAGLVKIIHDDGKSVRAAAAELGIDTATAMAWAAQMGVTVSRRPKALKHERRQALIEQLRLGADKADAAKNFQISVGTVTQVLRSEVGLHVQWQQARHQAAQNTARESWTKLITEHAALGVKFIRKLNPAAYAWLYRNDRAWLSEHTPARIVLERKRSTLWDDRDLHLSAEVERVTLALRSTLGKRKLMLWHLYQAIPELKAKLSALDRLPLTVRAIDVALQRRDSAKKQADLLI